MYAVRFFLTFIESKVVLVINILYLIFIIFYVFFVLLHATFINYVYLKMKILNSNTYYTIIFLLYAL